MPYRGQTLDVTGQLVVEECISCQVLFGFPASLKEQCLESRGPAGRQFYCPNGHGQHYIGKTEEQKLREQRDLLEVSLRAERDQREATERSLRATKGVLTKTRRRIHNGVCPHCHRTFKDVARHMQSRHPVEVAALA